MKGTALLVWPAENEQSRRERYPAGIVAEAKLADASRHAQTWTAEFGGLDGRGGVRQARRPSGKTRGGIRGTDYRHIGGDVRMKTSEPGQCVLQVNLRLSDFDAIGFGGERGTIFNIGPIEIGGAAGE